MHALPCRRIVLIAAMSTVLLSAGASRATSTATAPGEVTPMVDPAWVDAVWKVQAVHFAYQGYSTAYSCDTLRRKVRAILQRVGARETLTIRTPGCDDLSGWARVEITLASPVEATAENVRALTQHDSRDALVARVRNERLGTEADIERFPAVWQTISMSRDRELKLAPGDCELVRQLRRDVFPRLSVRIVNDNLRCSIAFGNIGRPRLSVTALVAVPQVGF